MCDVRDMTDEELKNLADRVAAELTDRKNKEKTALLKTLKDTVERLCEIDSNFYMNSPIRTACCGEVIEIDLFNLLLEYFKI